MKSEEFKVGDKVIFTNHRPDGSQVYSGNYLENIENKEVYYNKTYTIEDIDETCFDNCPGILLKEIPDSGKWHAYAFKLEKDWD